MVANSIPQDSLLFDNPGDLFADSSPAPLTDSSSISVNDNMFNLVPNDGSLLAVLPSCEATSSLGTTDGLQARNGELCQPKINLPVDMLSDPEAWLRNNLPLPIEHEAPDEFFDPFFWPDGTENDRARVGADEEEEDGTCAFPYEWHVCCDLEVGWRAGTFFDEMVIDYMDGCDLSTFFSLYLAVVHFSILAN